MDENIPMQPEEPDRRVKGLSVPDADGKSQWLGSGEVAEALRELLGRKLPGGCADCRATHTWAEELEGVFDLWIEHSETCPTLAGVEDQG